MVEKTEGQKLTGVDVLKGIAATGTILFCCRRERVFMPMMQSLLKDCRIKDTLATKFSISARDDTGVYQDAASLSLSTSQSQSLSEFNSQSASQSLLLSQSFANSQSVTASSSESLGHKIKQIVICQRGFSWCSKSVPSK